MFYYLIFAILLLGAGFLAYKISAADLRRRIIPDVYLFPFMLIGLLVVTFFPWITTPTDAIIAGTAGYALGAIIGYVFERVKKGGDYAPIGLGDVKLLGAGGFWLGTTGLAIAIVLACVFGMIWGFRRKQKYIPFAPFFFAGGILALLTVSFLI